MVKRRPGISILPLMLIVILCVSWLTQLNQRDEMTYDEMVQLFEQQKVEAFRFTDSSTLMLQVKGSDQPVRCRIHDYTLFYSDLNDLVKEQKAAGIIKSYSYPPPEGTDWLGIMLPYLMMALMFGGMWYLMSVRAQGGMGPDRMAKFGSAQIRGLSEKDKQVTFADVAGADEEKEELRERIDELEAMLVAQDSKPSTMEEQVALLEKSYELAAKYQNDNNAGQAAQPDETGGSVSTGEKSMKAEPVSDVRRTVVSALPQPMTDSAFIADYSGERNYGFHTAIGAEETTGKNTIAACVQGDQTLTDGQTVKLRLLEPMEVADKIIPRNAVVVGTAKIQGERLDIGITSLEYDGTIIPVELAVYDTDGQPGIFIPNSMEMNAVREVAANMGGSLGSSINISTNAGAQLASDLGKGLIQGTSQYIAKKMRTVKVHLKSGYKVMLYQDRD